MTYQLFVSYKHSARGHQVSESLEAAVKKYAKPLLARPPRVFRDDSSLVPGPDLPSRIKRALDEAEFFVLIASPEAAESVWVQQELRHWCSEPERVDRLLVVLADGEIATNDDSLTIDWTRTDALPTWLRDHLAAVPLYLDLRWARTTDDLHLSNPRFKAAIRTISSRLRGLEPTEMDGEETKLFKRNRRLATGGLTLILCLLALSSGASIYALWQNSIARERAWRNQMLHFSARAQVLQDTDPTAAIRMAESAYASLDPTPPPVQRSFAEVFYDALLEQRLFYAKSLAHPGRAANCRFAGEDKELLTTSGPTLFRWTVSGERLAAYPGHEDEIFHLEHDDPKDVALTVSSDKLLLRDRNGVVLAQVRADGEPIVGGTMNALEERIFSVRKSRVDVLSFKGKKLTTTIPSMDAADIRYAVLSPSGGSIFVGEGNRGSLWSPMGELKGRFDGYVDTAAVFCGGGEYLLTGAADTIPKLWNASGECAASLKGHHGHVRAVAFLPHRRRLVSADDGGEVRIWEWTGTLVRALPAHVSAVFQLIPMDDGRRFVSVSADATARVWDDDGTPEGVLLGHSSYLTEAAVSRDGSMIATASNDGTVKLWDKGSMPSETKLLHRDWVNAVAISPDGKLIATVSNDMSGRIWDEDGRVNASLDGHTGYVYSVAFAPDGKSVVTASADGTARTWSLSGEAKLVLRDEGGGLLQARFSPDGRLIVAVGLGGGGSIWSASGDRVAKLRGHDGFVHSVAFAPQGDRIVTASADHTAKVWNTRGELLATLEGHAWEVNDAKFFPDGQSVLTISDDATARIWDRSGTLVRTLDGHTGSIMTSAISRDGQWLVTGSADRKARIWSREGELIAELIGHDLPVAAVAISPDGHFVVTAEGTLSGGANSYDVMLWERRGELLARLAGHVNTVVSAQFSPDASVVVTASHDHSARIWPTPRGIERWLHRTRVAEFTSDYLAEQALLRAAR